MISEQQVKSLRSVYLRLEKELSKLLVQGERAPLGFGEGEYEAPDLWGRMVALNRLVSELEPAGAAKAGDVGVDVKYAVALHASWEAFWELDKVLGGRRLEFGDRQVVLDMIADLDSSREGGKALDSFIAKLGE